MSYQTSDRCFLPTSGPDLPLVHITKSFTQLMSILNSGFQASYCRERLCTDMPFETLDQLDKLHFESFAGSILKKEPRVSPGQDLAASFPMVSFSCIDPNEATSTLRSYGQFGIAMSSSWGVRNKLNPVQYLQQSSDVSRQLFKSFLAMRYLSSEHLECAMQNHHTTSSQYLWIRQAITSFAYSKNYYGPLIRRGVIEVPNYCFGFEREWRYVWLDGNTAQSFITESERNNDPDIIADATKRLQNVYLPLDVRLIRAIIVESDQQKDQVVEWFSRRHPKFAAPEIFINLMRHEPDFS